MTQLTPLVVRGFGLATSRIKIQMQLVLVGHPAVSKMRMMPKSYMSADYAPKEREKGLTLFCPVQGGLALLLE